jgi:hypothetical protein
MLVVTVGEEVDMRIRPQPVVAGVVLHVPFKIFDVLPGKPDCPLLVMAEPKTLVGDLTIGLAVLADVLAEPLPRPVTHLYECFVCGHHADHYTGDSDKIRISNSDKRNKAAPIAGTAIRHKRLVFKGLNLIAEGGI